MKKIHNLFNIIPSLLESDALLSRSTREMVDREQIRQRDRGMSFTQNEEFFDVREAHSSPNSERGREEKKIDDIMPMMQKPFQVKPQKINLSQGEKDPEVSEEGEHTEDQNSHRSEEKKEDEEQI